MGGALISECWIILAIALAALNVSIIWLARVVVGAFDIKTALHLPTTDGREIVLTRYTQARARTATADRPFD